MNSAASLVNVTLFREKHKIVDVNNNMRCIHYDVHACAMHAGSLLGIAFTC